MKQLFLACAVMLCILFLALPAAAQCDPACVPSNQCMIAFCDTSSGVPICSETPAKEGAYCDDGNPCTVSDACSEGFCAGVPADNTPCDDGRTCTVNDVCTDGVCAGTPKADTTVCDDGNSCTVNDMCKAGSCVGTDLALGATCDSDDNPCTNDVCKVRDRKLVCTHPAVIDGTVCNDGVPCTTAGTCSSGVCAGTGFSAEGTPCEADKNLCTKDVCDANGACTHPISVTCGPPADLCHLQGSCEPATGLCTKPVAAEGTPCEADTNLCTADVCDAKGMCTHEPVPPGSACVGGTCNKRDQCIPLTCADVPMTRLWPPNHKFVPVTLTVPGAAESGVTIDSVMSSEPLSVKGAGGKSKEPDAYLSKTDPLTVFVRSERSGLDKGKSGGFGRLYTISYSASNNFDTTCKGNVKVCVPHDQSAAGKAGGCQDSGAKYNAL